jgi:hypothetical protein
LLSKDRLCPRTAWLRGSKRDELGIQYAAWSARNTWSLGGSGVELPPCIRRSLVARTTTHPETVWHPRTAWLSRTVWYLRTTLRPSSSSCLRTAWPRRPRRQARRRPDTRVGGSTRAEERMDSGDWSAMNSACSTPFGASGPRGLSDGLVSNGGLPSEDRLVSYGRVVRGPLSVGLQVRSVSSTPRVAGWLGRRCGWLVTVADGELGRGLIPETPVSWRVCGRATEEEAIGYDANYSC